jgi:hypothetical protein
VRPAIHRNLSSIAGWLRARLPFVIAAVATLAMPALALWSAIWMPGRSYRGALPALTAEQSALAAELAGDVRELAGHYGERSSRRYAMLVHAADWIDWQLRAAGYVPHQQTFRVDEDEYWNIQVDIPGTSLPNEIVVVGAHYDSATGSPGANDNGSGVAALLALARRFHHQRPARTLRLIWFANEEQPHFQEPTMGSLHAAYRSSQRSDDIVAMLSLETIGYFSDAPDSQRYPTLVAPFYPSTGNFIAFVGNPASRALVHRVVGAFRRHARFPSEGAALPASVPGVGWSDQWSYWQQGYPAVMVTDTAPFRYPYYHSARDTADRLDYARMARVTLGLRDVVAELLTAQR